MSEARSDQLNFAFPERTHWTVNFLFPAVSFKPIIDTETTANWRTEYHLLQVPDMGRRSITYPQRMQRDSDEVFAGVGLLWESSYGRFDREAALVYAGSLVRDLLGRHSIGDLACRLVQVQSIDIMRDRSEISSGMANATADYVPIDESLQLFREATPDDLV